jgi:hypothetical protein
MNQSDRAALAQFAEQLDALGRRIDALGQLTNEETVKALDDLVRIAPTLTELAEGYKAAGWFGRFVKWIGGIGGALLAIVAIWTIFFGDQKP